MDHISSELNKLKIDKSKRSQPPQRHGRSKGFWVIAVLLLMAGTTAAVYAFFGPPDAVTVDTVRPRMESASGSAVLVASGYVVPHHKIQVGSKIAGRVAWIGVEKGDTVAANQTIVRLEDREYRAQYEQARAAAEAAAARLAELEKGSRPEEIERAFAEMERAEAQLRTDEANFRRVENLVREGVASSQTLDEARGRFDTARAALQAATKTYELVHQGPRQEQVDTARSEALRARAATDYAMSILDATEIRVPIAGTILERNVEQGEMVTTSFVGDRGAKSFVVTLADLSDIQVELDINQNDFNRIGPRQPCTAVTDAYPDRVYECEVYEIAPEANRQKATVQVKVKILEPDEYIKPEMNARVTFLEAGAETPSADQSLYIVPQRAVLEREGGTAVYVVSEGRVQVKPITIHRTVGTDVYVSSGLTGTEAIIVGDALASIAPGDPVVPR